MRVYPQSYLEDNVIEDFGLWLVIRRAIKILDYG